MAFDTIPSHEAIIRGLRRTLEAYRADEMFCTGTIGELAGITELDRRTVGDGTVGPMTQRFSELHREETANQGYALRAEDSPE